MLISFVCYLLGYLIALCLLYCVAKLIQRITKKKEPYRQVVRYTDPYKSVEREYDRCIIDGAYLVTLWWLFDIDGLQMQKDGTVKHIGRRDSPWQAENHFWQGTIQTPGDYTKTTEVHGPQTTVKRLAKMKCCGRDEDGYLIFDDCPEYETVTDIAGNKTICEVF